MVALEVGMECKFAFYLPSLGLLNRSRPRRRLPLYYFILVYLDDDSLDEQ